MKWTLFLLVLIQLAFSSNAAKSTPLDDELKSMSDELDTMGNKPQQQQPAQAQPAPEQPKQEKSVAGRPLLTNKDIIRTIELEPDQQMVLVQGKVAPKVIATERGDQFAVMPLEKKTTPCPPTTTKKPQTHMFCQSCGKRNPKEEGLKTSYIDVASATECARLCARYISKGKECSVWEFHGEWRNRQCFLLYIEDFPPCKGQLGIGSTESFESGTCVKQTVFPNQKPAGLELDNKKAKDGLPKAFPHTEVASSLIQENKFIVPAAIGSVLIFAFGFYYASTKTQTEYTALPEEI